MMRFFKALKSKPQTAQLCCFSVDHPAVTGGRGHGENTKGRQRYDRKRGGGHLHFCVTVTCLVSIRSIVLYPL